MDTRSSNLGRWSALDDSLFLYVIARSILYEPNIATSLLRINSSFHKAAVTVLYEELYIPDEEEIASNPPPKTRLEAVLLWPNRGYASHVRTLVLVPHPVALQGADSSFGDSMSRSCSTLQPETLGQVLPILPNLEAFVWATDRPPIHSLCSVLRAHSPQLRALLVRPTTTDGFHSHRRVASQENLQSPLLSPQRYDAFMLQALSSLQTLSVSGLSVDGVRELQRFLQNANQLLILTVDSQFVDDALLVQIAELRRLKNLVIKSSGTKMTDKGLLAILYGCEILQSLTLTEVEGRLHRAFWSRLTSLPPGFHSLRIAFNEEGPHHSWVADHLSSVFETLKVARRPLQVFSLTRIVPKGIFIPVAGPVQGKKLQRSANEEYEPEVLLKRVFPGPCDEAIQPRPLQDDEMELLAKHGCELSTLELDMFVLSIVQLRRIVDTCQKLRTLRVLLDAPLTKVLSMSSAFVTLIHLHTLTLSITDAHCPNSGLVKTPASIGNGNNRGATVSQPSTLHSLVGRRRSDTQTGVNFSGDSLVTSGELPPAEAESLSASSSPRLSAAVLRRPSMSILNTTVESIALFDEQASAGGRQGVEGIQGSVGSFDTSVPSKREIRKFARRCPALRILRWTGRNGKGEWRIAVGASSIQAHLDFFPVHLCDDLEIEQLTLGTGVDIEAFIKGKRTALSDYPGKLDSPDESDVLMAGPHVPTEEMPTRSAARMLVMSHSAQSRDVGNLAKRHLPGRSKKQDGPQKKGAAINQEEEEEMSLKPTSSNRKGRPSPVLTSGQVARSIPPSARKIESSESRKTYAAISDPSSPPSRAVTIPVKAKGEMRAKVLSESNGRKSSITGRSGSCLSSSRLSMTLSATESPSVTRKGRAEAIPAAKKDDSEGKQTSGAGQSKNIEVMASRRGNKKKTETSTTRTEHVRAEPSNRRKK